MRKTKILAVLGGILSSVPFMAGAAYPVYNSPNNLQIRGVQNNYGMFSRNAYPVQNTNIIPNQLAAASAMNGRPMMNIGATNPNRVTGALPRVGSSATNAGRQYYQATDYDRLADSGLYIGLSAGYTTMTKGSMSADYANQDRAFMAPGSFRPSDFQKDSLIPLQISVGAAINSDVRVDFSFLRYSGLSYGNVVQTYTGDGYTDATVSGGAITSNSTMLNVYYNIDSYTGYVAGGSLRPYVGVGIGLALNTIADYVVYDNGLYPELSEDELYNPENAGAVSMVSDIYAYHNGGTMEQIAYSLEAGVTTDMNDGLKLDFFVRYANLGKIKTSGSVVVSQTEWITNGAGEEFENEMPMIYHFTNWFESGSLSNLDIGVRLRLEF